MAARNEYRHRRQTKASTIMQTKWRQHHAISVYKQKKRATLTLQCLWRARVARKELRKLRMAARDAGALREAKDKLEKRVEELTWRLEFEKHLRTDLEEAKGQEIANLQKALQEMQVQLEEERAAIIQEKEAAKIAIEQAPPVIKEVPVVDNTKVEELTNENTELQGEMSELKKRIEEFEQTYFEVQKESQSRQKEMEESQLKASQLQDTIERLQVDLSNLESENQVLRQQALANESITEEMETLKTRIKDLETENELLRSQRIVEQIVSADRGVEQITTVDDHRADQIASVDHGVEQMKIFENGHISENGHHKEKEPQTTKEEQQIANESGPNTSILTKQKSMMERQQETFDALVKCLKDEKRFEKGRPVAACITFKALLHWRSLEAEKSSIFDRIIHTIRSSMEESTEDLAYWLSTTSTLLVLLQSAIKASSTSARRNRSSSTTLFDRLGQGLRTSSTRIRPSRGYSGMEGSPIAGSRIEAKYPALLFKQHLTACVEKLYGTIRDNIKKEISPLLNLCIQAPRSARIRPLRGSPRNIHSNIIAKQQASSVHWQNIVNSLDRALEMLSESYVPPVIIRKLFSQVFAFINVQLFNSLLLRRECCSFSNGEYVKAGLQELEQWCLKATEEFAGTSWDELQHLRQAVGILVLHQKAQKSLDEITNEICPVLSTPQIYRIGTMFWDDKYGTQGLSLEVISRMRTLTVEDSNTMPNNTFLLDVDSSIPFSIEEISQSIQDISISDVDPPTLLRQRSDFHFLFQSKD